MHRLGLLQPDPPAPATHKLDIRIPSPARSPSGTSTGYPSPTPSLPGTQATPQYVQLNGAPLLLHPGIHSNTLLDNGLPTLSLGVATGHRTIASRQLAPQPWRPW